MNIPCADKINCVCPDPALTGFNSETPDADLHLSTGHVALVPVLGAAWDRLGCMQFTQSTVSQQVADLASYQAAFDCITSTWSTGGLAEPPVPPPQEPQGGMAFPQFTNAPQSATIPCPDGLPFTYSVPAGLFPGFSQLDADTRAASYALDQGQQHQICLGPLARYACPNAPYAATISATGLFLAQAPAGDFWEVTSGALPPGLHLQTGFITGGQALLSGTPTVPGTYNFTVGIIDPSGDFMQKPYTITVLTVPTLLFDDGVAPAGWIGCASRPNLGLASGGPMVAITNLATSTILTDRLDTHAQATLVLPGVPGGLGYSPANDCFVVPLTGAVLRVTPAPLAVLSSLPATTGNAGDVEFCPLNGFIYWYDGAGMLTVYDPVGNAVVGQVAAPANTLFQGSLSFDLPGKRLFIGLLNSVSVPVRQSWVAVYDISGNTPVLINQMVIPPGQAGNSVVVFGCCYAAQSGLVYVTVTDASASGNFLARVNPNTGAITGKIFGYTATFGQLQLNPVTGILFVPDGGGFMRIICTMSDTVLGNVAFSASLQGCFASFNNSVAYVNNTDVVAWG